MSPSVILDHVGARYFQAFAAQWLAYALPYRRFDTALADCVARLGVDAVCYSFIVADFHHLLPAGFAGAPKFQNYAPAILGRKSRGFERTRATGAVALAKNQPNRGDKSEGGKMLTESQLNALIATACLAVLVFAAFAGAYASGSVGTTVSSFGGPFAAVIAASIAAGAAYIAARTAATISYSNKIAEFRQAWIIALRSDIADYVAAAELWFWKWDELNSILNSEEKGRRILDEATPLSVAARTILNRIRLRLNPRENADKPEDDRLLKSLDDLLSPAIQDPLNAESSWRKTSDAVVEQAIEILKREWQKTKAVINPTPASAEETLRSG